MLFYVIFLINSLENYRDIDAFKIYVSDTGLLCAKNFSFENGKKTFPSMPHSVSEQDAAA